MFWGGVSLVMMRGSFSGLAVCRAVRPRYEGCCEVCWGRDHLSSGFQNLFQETRRLTFDTIYDTIIYIYKVDVLKAKLLEHLI
jgi:hypothetical protein